MSTNSIFIISVLTVLILAVPVGAEHESFVMGQYKVSFDINDVGSYTVHIQPPSKGETFSGISYTRYQVWINGTSSYAIIGIADFATPVKNNVEGAIRDAAKSSPRCGEPMITNRTIDGKQGALSSSSCSDSPTSYMFSYPLGYFPENNTMTSAILSSSTYPWNGGTSALVKTIHVEKALSLF
jgi:hypothetical protein